MMRLLAISVAAGLLAAAAGAQAPSDQQLIAQAPQASVPGFAVPQDDLSAAEQAARSEAYTALARLELILGRQALRAEDWPQAARKAQRVLILLRQLPPAVDVGELELQAEGILAKAARAGVNVEALQRDAVESAPLTAEDAELDRQVQGAVRVGEQYGGPPRRDIDSSGDARALRERAVRRGPTRDFGYRPGQALIDVDAILAEDEQRLMYQDALRTAYKADEVRVLVEGDEARLVPDGNVAYPPDWSEKVQRRKQWAGGVIAQTPSWYDKNGREWYIAVYDISDLTFVVPDFATGTEFRTLYEAQRDALDRQALRDHHAFFRGGGEGADCGLPLLRYFGGVNVWATTPAYSPERQEQVVQLIRAFVGGEPEETILSLPPIPPGQ